MLRILCLLLLLSSFYSHATTLLVYGDSLSAGYQLPVEQSWPALLNARWQEQGQNLHLINASVSGETTQGGLARLTPALQQNKPDWVLIELGANDGLRGQQPWLTRKNLQDMLDLIKQHGSRAILTQIRIPPNYGARYVRQFEAIYPELADENEVPLLPFFIESLVTDSRYMLPDGLHPNADGQQQICTQLEGILTPLLTKS